MERIKYRVSLDMFEVVKQTTIKAKKGDTACSVYITLTENGKVYNITEGCYAVFSGKKSDGNYLFNSETCRIEGNTIVYDFTSQTTACEGLVECEVILYKGEDRLTSATFNLMVDATIYNGEEIISTPEADALNELIEEADKAVTNFVSQTTHVSNALKGSESGAAVAMKDVSPLEHNIGVKLSRYKYDFNGDGKVDEEDKNHLLYHVNFPSFEDYALSSWSVPDVNGDGKVDSDDATALGNMLKSGDKAAFETVNLPEGVTLTKQGKNILPYPYVQTVMSQGGIDWTDNGDGTMTANGTPIGKYNVFFNLTRANIFKDGVTYTASVGVKDIFSISLEVFDNQTNKQISIDTTKPFTWDSTRYEMRIMYLVNHDVATVNGLVLKPMVEVGTIATEYEQYQAPETIPVNADGTASVIGKGESITLSTDAEGVTIEAEYNRDINKAFAELLAKIGG